MPYLIDQAGRCVPSSLFVQEAQVNLALTAQEHQEYRGRQDDQTLANLGSPSHQRSHSDLEKRRRMDRAKQGVEQRKIWW